MLRWIVAVCALMLALPVQAEDGYDLWQRYRPVEAGYAIPATSIVSEGTTPTLTAAAQELERGLSGLSGKMIETGTLRDNAIIIGTPSGSAAIALLNPDLTKAGEEGYVIRTTRLNDKPVTIIAANRDIGVLYGVFEYLKLIQTRQPLTSLNITDAPKVKLRVLNHWDNLDGSVERGYAGTTIWDWWKLPDVKHPRYTDYARANASVGINGTVLNNVNSNAVSLSPPYIAKTAALADIFRPYGIKVYLSARFSAPIEEGGLKTADPLDPQVRAWWKAKSDEIYAAIPDFGGFLVKANSEGQPGPQDYKRSHADGANMLAEALKPHGGIVMWRAFVYSHEKPDDRHKQAYDEFKALDGQFADNVLVQVKNGAIDFQPREPFHPLFGAMPKTPLMMEFQITKEYLGFSTHLAYLGQYYEEALKADTFANGKAGNTVAKVVEGAVDNHTLTGIAGVANIGMDRNWSGSDFDQANWYAFGRLAWNPQASSRAIADDWARMTLSNDPAFVAPVVDMMMTSRETVADYMTPLGLHHLMDTGHHYGPGPWVDNLERADWNPVYYHKADINGIGFDRMKTGSNAIAQYTPKAAKLWADPKTMDERYLLWFHHLPWDHKVKSGRSLWDEVVVTYSKGASDVTTMRNRWASLKPYVDAERFDTVATNLMIQEREARWWRDASVAYFQSISKRPLPAGYAAPEKTLDYYRSLKFPYAPGN
ncbi:alpha-glucuronidase family glycosyl hydrolase [Asticcacaulis sp. ZE23SCel15]|uniref:alpha-glucuronidase family glycosyl hydrolase n=1 Tax=Asticcacaulis sp. ZE23SCel15 TaxID=3059027 RepID=UPI002660494D|nr:alpha-glucuronidase family glycosyl hydrolase [Asticcacaulis sp. ZE23SCel15]WKL58341.1 alpha-glucuronidase family glycosyl hydrolase [Asticcacaulis sp. ZE23SCel15]